MNLPYGLSQYVICSFFLGLVVLYDRQYITCILYFFWLDCLLSWCTSWIKTHIRIRQNWRIRKNLRAIGTSLQIKLRKRENAYHVDSKELCLSLYKSASLSACLSAILNLLVLDTSLGYSTLHMGQRSIFPLHLEQIR